MLNIVATNAWDMANSSLSRSGYSFLVMLLLIESTPLSPVDSLEHISKLILKRKREEIMADQEKGGKRPEAQQRCIEDAFSLTTPYAVISTSCSQKRF